MSTFPTDLRYTPDHEWLRAQGSGWRVGITQFAVDQLGDITLVDLPKQGDLVTKGQRFGTIESVKSVSDLYAPVSGKIVAINAQLKRRLINATVVPFKSREEAFAALEADKVDVFASDRLLLAGAATKSKDQKSLALLPEELSIEPYGIVLPRGDASFRLAVNTGLAQLYSSGEIVEIFRRWFENLGPPPGIILAAYALGAIPE